MPYSDIIDAVRSATTGRIDTGTIGYITHGGTYVIASDPRWNDDGAPHDLAAVLPTPLEGTRVHPLRATVDPTLIDALRAQLDDTAEENDNTEDLRVAASQAINRAANEVLQLVGGDDQARVDAINLLVNLTLAYIDNPDHSQDEAIRDMYHDDPEDIRQHLGL